MQTDVARATRMLFPGSAIGRAKIHTVSERLYFATLRKYAGKIRPRSFPKVVLDQIRRKRRAWHRDEASIIGRTSKKKAAFHEAA
jgi:hypothetical protein